MKIVKDLVTGKEFQFVEYVQHGVNDCSFISSTPHVKVRDLNKGTVKYLPINQIEIVSK
ncbi:hypothetical protein [Enterococcus gilvus]|uniref:Uncharacterized protein n=1 Tax=Enterococcus gilvus ATCC BAA-350 TaxID=1158614 RepID=R2X9L8_9ENTE|nr:hypothetical protein [Enterococcus gilvus]EOI51474.1 hypothetical protein UKC_04149 [Enterococcus gilvus ATCC BAA-350]EOW77215.1 hypothetical protein I592_04191 [Enterococcus gilvus ATCC BAA-350]OJG41126.1 hypothetical protein RV02_GL001213 [Enterococcus gilvus]